MKDIDYSEYDKEFDKLKIKLSSKQRKDIVDFFYQLSHIAYEYYIYQEKNYINNLND